MPEPTLQLRENYWITSMRRFVKAVIHRCVVCKRVDGSAYSKPIPAPLPKFRVQQTVPFSTIGIDYTGHLLVKDTITQSIVKVYICLFTCRVSRAVHLELVRDLSTESFLQALRRFAARRSTPTLIVSDNASTFVSTANELQKISTDTMVLQYLSENRITWRFTPKRSPWCGGLFKRMISITKTSLKKILGRACVSYTELATIITEIECAINARPLTHVASDISDLNPLTPSQLINGREIRVFWSLARITKLLPGSDGIVRVVEIRTKHGKTNRDISRLYPLELSSETELVSRPNSESPSMEDSTPIDVDSQPTASDMDETQYTT
ncbi:uncharacterized protein LOC144357604, partial [Saccoglossus kowalevskii]